MREKTVSNGKTSNGLKKLILIIIGLLTSTVLFAQEQKTFQVQKSTYMVNPVLSRAIALEKAGKIREAISLLQEECKEKPDDCNVHLQLGNLLVNTTRYSEAIDVLKRAKMLNSKLIPAHFLLALVYEKVGEYKKAIKEWKKCLKIHRIDQETCEIARKHIEECKRKLKEKKRKRKSVKNEKT